MDYQSKKRIRILLQSRVTSFLLIIFILFVANGTWDVYSKARKSKANLDEVKQSLTEAQKKKEDLSKEIEFISTERGKEEIIRDKFNVALEDEKVVIIIEPETSDIPVSVEKKGIFSGIKSFFSNLVD